MLKINTKIIEKEIETLLEVLSKHGRTEDNGITRLLFSDDWSNAQKKLMSIMQNKGFKTYFDEVGNLYGTIYGEKEQKETILIGSHIDTVVNGGILDGQYGIIAGIIALETLIELKGTPKKNVEVVSLAEEEGSRFPFTFWGSKNIVGSVKKDEVENLEDQNGVRFLEALNCRGFTLKAKPTRNDLISYLELHIEQGCVLEKENKDIGIVDSIVGQKRFIVEVHGEANHAGTTPMKYRKDALVASSKMIVAINEMALEHGDPLVATVGKLDINPNTSNVVPGSVKFTLDIRHTKEDNCKTLIEKLKEKLLVIAKKNNVTASISQYMDGVPAVLDPSLVKKLEDICISRDVSYLKMHSGAGHDAQIFANTLPSALIFVPSIGGISHNPKEKTNINDLAKGIEILIELIYSLAY